MWQSLSEDIKNGDFKALARGISLVENESEGYEQFLSSLLPGKALITGITGSPGAGKSTLVDAMIHAWVHQGKKIGVLCVDPSSPFNLGALLGDRIRMSEWYTHPQVFIRSLASRGALGGLHPFIMEIAFLMQSAHFDHVIIETVGVGQSEIEIAGLADTTLVVMVPEGGDEIQTMKAGLMEIADIFVLNKSDRPGADIFVKNLRTMLSPVFQHKHYEVPILQTIAAQRSGIAELVEEIEKHQSRGIANERKTWLLAERAFKLIQRNRMKDIDKSVLQDKIARQSLNDDFNLYLFVKEFITRQ